MPMSAPQEERVPTTASRRDLRLDFFRGLALWFIFIDHVPSSVIGNLTFRNFGFSDATEIFVFISGYTAAIVYGASMRRNGFVYMLFQVLKRCWQLYAAHILLFVFFIAQITWVSNRFNNASFIEELNIMQFHDDPQESIVRALILHYRPVNLDVLPLYMALLAGFPLLHLADGQVPRPLPAPVALPVAVRPVFRVGAARLRVRRHLALQPARLAAVVRDRGSVRVGSRRGSAMAALAAVDRLDWPPPGCSSPSSSRSAGSTRRSTTGSR
jgi:cbb3-type cytochrome oxidase subunit 3